MMTVKGIEEVGERKRDRPSRSAIRIAEVVTGKLFLCSRVIDGPQIPMCGVQEGSACGRRDQRVWSGDLWPIPVFLEGSDPARGVLGDAGSFVIDRRVAIGFKPDKDEVDGPRQFVGAARPVSRASSCNTGPRRAGKRTVIGRYRMMTPEQAREAAWNIPSVVAKGSDPAAAPEPDRNAVTVSALCDWFLAEAEAGRILGRPIKASTLAMDRSRIEAHIRPLLGAHQVGALTLGDIDGAQTDIAAGKTAKPRAGSRGGATTGGEGVAARAMSTLHAIFEQSPATSASPSSPLRRCSVTPRVG
jgi:hypothetical protein